MESTIRKQVNEFLADTSQRTIKIKIPSDFSLSWIRNPFLVGFRKVMILILSKVPPMHLKTWIFQQLGYDFGRDVCLPGFIGIDPYFPELISLGEGTLVGGFTQIKPWKLEKGTLTLGRIYCAPQTLFAGWTRLHPGAHINEHTITGVKSIIDTEIPKDSFVIKHNKVIKTWSKDEIERHFGKSNHDPKYVQKVKRLMRKFRYDPKERRVTFRNNGKRLNAGCDWYLAKPVWIIYWKGFFVELSRLLPFEPLRKLCYWIIGVRWGKNFRLGRRVYFDHIVGNFVRLGDNVTLEDDVFMDGHEYTVSETVYGKTVVGNNVTIKKGSWVRGGATIGDNVVIEADSDVMKDVASGERVAGSPAKPVEKEERK